MNSGELLMSRDLDYEMTLSEIEESSKLNGYIMLNLMVILKKCTLEQLAVGLYLYRFNNVLQRVPIKAKENQSLNDLPQWDYFNLDTVLTPFLIEKYNDRFKKGFIELLSRNLIFAKDEIVSLNNENESGYIKEIVENTRVHKKCQYISEIIKAYPIETLNQIISKIVGEISD